MAKKIEGNQFAAMAGEARSVLRTLMHNTTDKKLKKEIAMAILESAGEKKAKIESGPTVQPIVIKDSQVQMLVQVGEEIKAQMDSAAAEGVKVESLEEK